MIEGVIYILRTGCPWRDLPECFGPWNSVYTRFRRWSKSGLWSAILDILCERAKGKMRFLDATHIKVHQDASNPAGGQQNQAIGRTKGGLNCKVTALVDSRGMVLQLTLAPGQMADVKAANEVVLPSESHLVADKGYDSDEFRNQIRQNGSSPCIPARSNRKNPQPHHRGYYRKRHQVENFFQRAKRFRRIGTRYEKLDETFLAFLQLAAVLDWVRNGF
jgi:transposase